MGVRKLRGCKTLGDFMGNNVKKLVLNEREIVLIGTAHVSQDSITEVNEYIETEKPDCVAIELDEQRLATLKDPESWRNLDIVKVLKNKQGWVLLANLVLSSFQKRMGENVGVKPGDEMKAATFKAEEMGIATSMVDRPIQITLRRAWAKNTFWGKCKLLAVLFSSIFEKEEISPEQIEQLKNSSEMDQMMNELASYLPGVKEVLIDERDRYLASHIWQSKGNKIVAVLGAGHLPGVEKWLGKIASNQESTDTSSISQVPSPSVVSKIAAWVIPVLLVGLVVAGFFKGGASKSAEMVLQWWLTNGALAALGSILALGHPLTILVSFVGAWFAAINPFIGIGVIAGLVQAWAKKPKVTDMEFLSQDATSFKGFYKNRILRVLLVFFLSSLGGSIGTFVSIPALISKIVG